MVLNLDEWIYEPNGDMWISLRERVAIEGCFVRMQARVALAQMKGTPELTEAEYQRATTILQQGRDQDA